MSVQVEKLENGMAKLTIEASAERLEEALQNAFTKNKNKISVPGFRKGKVPRQMIEKMYGPAIFYEDAANELIPEEYEKALDECEEDIVSSPEIDVTQIEKGKPFIFTAVVALKPEVKLGKYKGVKVDKADTAVTDEEVDAQINKERENNARNIEVTDRPVKDGDMTVLDFEGFVDGVAFDGGKGENYPLTIGSGAFIPGFEEQMVGMNVGEEKDLNVKFPDEYHSDELKGKDAVFHVKVHAIRTKELPEIDDELAKDVSDFDTMEQFRAHKKEELEEKAKQEAKINKENEVVAKAVENATVDIPEVMIERQMDRMLNDIRYRLSMQGISLEDYCKFTGTTMDAMKAEMKGDAERRVKTQLVLDAIVKAEDIKADPEAVEKKLDEYCAQFGDRAAEFKEKLSEDDKAYFEDQAVLDKTLEMLCDSAVEK